MPDGWPFSLWFFVITAIVYLLQRFPIPGVFLMVVGAALWSVLLVNLGMLGLIWEAGTGRTNVAWLLLPGLYFGGYYAAYFVDQRNLTALAVETDRFNHGKSMPFDPSRQDLVFGDPQDGLGMGSAQFAQRYGLARTFDGHGQVHLIGSSESCALLRNNRVFESAGIMAYPITRPGKRPHRSEPTGLCGIRMPGKPDRPIVGITERQQASKRVWMPFSERDYDVRDESTGTHASVRIASAQPLRIIPMPVMGCALNSGAPSWDCFHGFMRKRVELPLGRAPYSSGAPQVAELLGLRVTEDLSVHAIGPERFKPMADRADAELAANELALLERMLQSPETYIKDGSFRHLPNRPGDLKPYAERIFQALGQLQQSDLRTSQTGRELWKLAALLPRDVVSKHRATIAEWMKPGALREWTEQSWQAFTLLDLADPAQRDIVLSRLERPQGYTTDLLAGFCRMGGGAPQDVKERLLRLWNARAKLAEERGNHRPHEDVLFYLTLNRIGLKEQVGKVEQRYMGDMFLGIWNQITPDTPGDVCGLSVNDLMNRYRRR